MFNFGTCYRTKSGALANHSRKLDLQQQLPEYFSMRRNIRSALPARLAHLFAPHMYDYCKLQYSLLCVYQYCFTAAAAPRPYCCIAVLL